MYVIATATAIVAGLAIWFFLSYFVAASVLWAEGRYPKLAGSRGLRAYEIFACGTLVFVALATAFLIARAMIK